LLASEHIYVLGSVTSSYTEHIKLYVLGKVSVTLKLRFQLVFANRYFMLSEIRQFFKSHLNDILLFLIVFLLCFLSFGAGILTQFYLQKPPLEIEQIGE